jgi:hypothetical protein
MVFISIAFAGILAPGVLVTAVITQWLVKSTYEALATPITYWVVNHLKRKEGIDVYDCPGSLTPLELGD